MEVSNTNSSVKDLIKKFNSTTINNNVNVNVNVNNSLNNPIQRSSSRLANPNNSSLNQTYVPKHPPINNEDSDDYDLELDQLLKKAGNHSMHALNEMHLFKNNANTTNNKNMSKVCRIRNRHHQSSGVNNPLYQRRSHSVLNEPYKQSVQTNGSLSNHNNGSNGNLNMNNQLIKSALLNGTSDLFNRKKSKSVTFMDSIGNGCQTWVIKYT